MLPPFLYHIKINIKYPLAQLPERKKKEIKKITKQLTGSHDVLLPLNIILFNCLSFMLKHAIVFK